MMISNKRIRVLVGCEFSGAVRRAFRIAGCDAWSCDLLDASDSQEFHIKADVISILGDDWDIGIFHPPCTYLCSSGMHWTTRGLRDPKLTEDAIRFVEAIWDSPIQRIAIENPIGCLSTRSKLGKPTQIIQPYQFGHDASKQTCLWLKNLPELIATSAVPPRIVNGKKRWGNQTDSGQNKLPPSETRWAQRSETYSGIAEAMADQWLTCCQSLV